MSAKMTTPEQHAAWHGFMREPVHFCCWCADHKAKETTIATLQAEILSLRAALDKAEEALEKTPCRNESSSVETCQIATRVLYGNPFCGRCVALAAIRAAKAGRGEG